MNFYKQYSFVRDICINNLKMNIKNIRTRPNIHRIIQCHCFTSTSIDSLAIKCKAILERLKMAPSQFRQFSKKWEGPFSVRDPQEGFHACGRILC